MPIGKDVKQASRASAFPQDLIRFSAFCPFRSADAPKSASKRGNMARSKSKQKREKQRNKQKLKRRLKRLKAEKAEQQR